MAKAAPTGHDAMEPQAKPGHAIDWRKRMSDTVAYGLLAYTGLQIFVTMHAIEEESPSMLPIMALVLLVAGIIPLFRRFERRWEHLSDQEAADPALRPAFRRDQLIVWALAIGLPFALTGLLKAAVAIF